MVIIAALVIPSFIAPQVRTFLPTPAGGVRATDARGVDTVTIDSGDEARWRFLDFDRGSVVVPPDTADWDLALRRFHIIPSGPIANLGAVPFESVAAAPDSGYVTSAFGPDTSNAATARWYRYSYFSHLLSPRGDVYALRTRTGRAVKFQVLSYYCPGPTPGCVTVRYAFLTR
ncbi:MAG: HmuY family protein [Gemmatimonadetes bacterium]|nr:HmuY family protein [Gemmatimonadota bacterium]